MGGGVKEKQRQQDEYFQWYTMSEWVRGGGGERFCDMYERKISEEENLFVPLCWVARKAKNQGDEDKILNYGLAHITQKHGIPWYTA